MSRFDDVDITHTTTMQLDAYLRWLRETLDARDDLFVRRAIDLRICEVEERISEVQREIAVRNVRETKRQEGK